MDEEIGFFPMKKISFFSLFSLFLLLAFANGKEERAGEKHLVEIHS